MRSKSLTWYSGTDGVRGFGLVLLLYQLLAFPSFLQAQGPSDRGLNPRKSPSQYILRHWNTEDGLNSESTNDILQSSNGYIWIATYNGLHRFDGRDFTIFNNQNSQIPSSNVLRLSADSKNRVWIGTLHGLAVWDHDSIHVPEPLLTMKDEAVEAMLVTSLDEIWFSTKNNRIFLYSKNVLRELTADFGIPNSTVLTIEEAPNGKIYFGTDDSQLLVFEDDKLRPILHTKELSGINVLLSKENGSVLVGSGQGLFQLSGERLTKLPILAHIPIISLLSQRQDILWLGTMNGLHRYNFETASLHSLTEEVGLPNNIVRGMIFDDQQNLWGGTYRNGIFYISDGSIASYSKSTGLFSNIITGITQLRDGGIILGNENGKLNVLRESEVSEYAIPYPLPNARLKHLFTDSDDRLWASTYAGLYLIDGNNFKKFTVENGFPDNYIRMAYEDKEGNIWVGSKNAGLIKFDRDLNWKVINKEMGLTSNYIMSITENHKDELIVGTFNGINFMQQDRVVKSITVDDGLPSNFSFTTFPTTKYLWISSNDGLIAYSENRTVTFSTENGLPFNIVYDILADDQGNLWLPGKSAILKIKLAELEAAADQGGTRVAVEQYDRTEGVKNSHCLGAVRSFRDDRGRFWIPTLGGAVNIDPQLAGQSLGVSKTIIEAVYADGVKISGEGTVQIPPRTSRINIDFTGINFEQIEKMQFRYKLEPFEVDWVLANDERNAQYTNLAPGNYRFELQTGSNGVFENSPSVTTIVIEAAWWQTLSAKVLGILALVALGVIINRLRLQTLRAQNRRLEQMVSARTKALEEQKEELSEALSQLSAAQQQAIQSEKMASLGVLAAGVAHEINNPLNFILGSSHLLNNVLLNGENAGVGNGLTKTELKTILDDLSMGTTRIKKIVSSLNSFSRTDQDELVACNIPDIIENSLTILAHEIKGRIEIVKKFPSETVQVKGIENKLYQVFTNLLTNAIHAVPQEGGKITVEIIRKDNHSQVQVIDNGAGIPKALINKVFDPFFTTKEVGKGTGLGMTIAFNIVQEHGGEIIVDSQEGLGTTITVTLPNG